MRETEAGPREARKCLPEWRGEGWDLAGSPSRKFRRSGEQPGCGEPEQSGAGAGAGRGRSLSGEEVPRCDEQERAGSGRPTGWAAGCS